MMAIWGYHWSSNIIKVTLWELMSNKGYCRSILSGQWSTTQSGGQSSMEHDELYITCTNWWLDFPRSPIFVIIYSDRAYIYIYII